MCLSYLLLVATKLDVSPKMTITKLVAESDIKLVTYAKIIQKAAKIIIDDISVPTHSLTDCIFDLKL